MAGPGLGPNAPLDTIDGALKQTVRAKAATASATIATGTSTQCGRRFPLDGSASFKKTPRPREDRAARVGGKRRPEGSLAGGVGAAWGRLWVLFSRFLSMIFFHRTAEPVTRAHGPKSAL